MLQCPSVSRVQGTYRRDKTWCTLDGEGSTLRRRSSEVQAVRERGVGQSDQREGLGWVLKHEQTGWANRMREDVQGPIEVAIPRMAFMESRIQNRAFPSSRPSYR